jgi:hypothetical protein
VRALAGITGAGSAEPKEETQTARRRNAAAVRARIFFILTTPVYGRSNLVLQTENRHGGVRRGKTDVRAGLVIHHTDKQNHVLLPSLYEDARIASIGRKAGRLFFQAVFAAKFGRLLDILRLMGYHPSIE